MLFCQPLLQSGAAGGSNERAHQFTGRCFEAMDRVVSTVEVVGLGFDGRRHARLFERLCITARVIPNEYTVASECRNIGFYRTALGWRWLYHRVG